MCVRPGNGARAGAAQPGPSRRVASIVADPMILTLRLDADAMARLERERRAFFPAARNVIPAHVTLFQRLPGERVDHVAAGCAAVARRWAPVEVRATGVMPFSQGGAIALEVPGFARLRAALAGEWDVALSDQDRAGRKPHATVMNRTRKAAAGVAMEMLRARFAPFDATAEGVDLWHYRGGPWEPAGSWWFAGG